mmetsp:Transcript_55447/g.162868  ORF Transcript_55447/g.162868 Transcript_55447/m.162868 type:complete len:212 (-) Transcript_55447:885-1520(-)
MGAARVDEDLRRRVRVPPPGARAARAVHGQHGHQRQAVGQCCPQRLDACLQCDGGGERDGRDDGGAGAGGGRPGPERRVRGPLVHRASRQQARLLRAAGTEPDHAAPREPRAARRGAVPVLRRLRARRDDVRHQPAAARPLLLRARLRGGAGRLRMASLVRGHPDGKHRALDGPPGLLPDVPGGCLVADVHRPGAPLRLHLRQRLRGDRAA